MQLHEGLYEEEQPVGAPVLIKLFLFYMDNKEKHACACFSLLSLSSATSPPSPHGGALAQLPETLGVAGMRTTEDLPRQAWIKETHKKRN